MDSPLKPFPLHLFRAYDIRGCTDLLNSQVVYATACALAEEYIAQQQQHLVIAYDARLSSPRYAQIIQQVCESYGLTVKCIGCCSSPMLYLIARDFSGNGIMVTASHNPKQDNGIKWLIQGEPPAAEQIQHIGQRAASFYQPQTDLDWSEASPFFDQQSAAKYRQAMTQDIHLNHGFKVVLDGLHGAAGHCAVQILQDLGCEVIALRAEPNGHFPDHAPDPSQEKHLQQLKQQILLQQADVGIALDGDGDRVVLLDEHAQFISADRLLALFAEMTLQNHPQHEVVFDVKCSSLVRDTIVENQGVATMIRTGSSYLRKYIAGSAGRAVFGGEYAGHYVFNDGRGFGYDDGIYAALRVLEYLAENQLSLAQLMQKYPARVGTEDLYISTHGEDVQQVLQSVKVQSQQISAKLSEIDGIRLDFDDGFGIIRASNTGEYFTLRFDAQSLHRLKEIQQLFIQMLTAYPKIADDIAQA